MDSKIMIANATIVLNTVSITAIYVGADGRVEATLLRVSGLSCLSDLQSLSESGLYMALQAHAPLGDDWEWRREMTRAEGARSRAWCRRSRPQYGSRPRS